MKGKYRILSLILTLTVIVTVVTGITITTLYNAAFEQAAERLTETARSWARIIESVARFDERYSAPGFEEDPFSATLDQVREAHGLFEGFGESGEFTLARLEGDQIVFLLRHRHTDLENPEPVPFDSTFAEPMRRALLGESGTLVGLDYRGEKVLAAHEPVAVQNLGIVAKIDLREVRAPFVRAGQWAGGMGLALIVLGTLLFLRIGTPMVHGLRKSEERLSLALSSAGLGSWDWHLENNALVLDDSLHRLFGLEPDSFSGGREDYLAMIHPEDQDRVRRDMDMTLSGQTSYDNEYRAVWPDGTVHDLAVRGRIYRDRTGEPKRLAGVVWDISDRKLAEDALRESEEQFRLISDESLTGIFIHQNDLLVYVNPCLARMLDYSPAEPKQYLGREFIEFVHPDEREAIARNVALRLRGDEPLSQYESRLIDRNGKTVWVDLMAKVIEISGQPAVMGTVLDITERKLAQQENEKLEVQLRQAMKMEAIGRLAGGIAHDFNNILTGIIGFTELIQSKVSRHDPVFDDLVEIQHAGERAAALTQQLLAFSRKQIVTPMVIDLNKTIDRTNRMIGRIIGEDIRLHFMPSESIWPVKIAPSQVDQILINLATNARDAMPSGGKLTIETATATIDEDSHRHADEALPQGDYTMLAVSDDGSGMDTNTLNKIFEPFFSTKEKDQGTGLGLATIYGIVKQNDGFITVYSEKGCGTTFKIYFPREGSEIDPQKTPKPNGHPRGTERVLLVEDEEMVRMLAVRILEMQGYQVLTAIDGEEAQDICLNTRGQVDLLLTDVIMPRMNGRELFDAIQEKRPGLKVLFMSGYTDDIVARHGILERGTNFLPKPFTIGDLSRAVRTALDDD